MSGEAGLLRLGGIFVVTLLISATTGGNMFQAWNVAESTYDAFKIPRPASGIVLALLAALLCWEVARLAPVVPPLVASTRPPPRLAFDVSTVQIL